MLKNLLGIAAQLKTLTPVFNFFGGRFTTFGIFFAVTGFWLAAHGQLTATYVGLIGAIQALVLGHSIKEDIYSGNNQ